MVGGTGSGWRVGGWAAHANAAAGGSSLPCGAVAPPPQGGGAAGPDLHQARPDHLERRGPLPRGAGRGVQGAAATRCPPRPSTRCDGSSRRTWAARWKRCSSTSSARPIAAASIAQVHAARLRPPATSARPRGRGQGPAADHPHPGPLGPEGDGLAGAVPGRAHPDRRAGQPAGAGRAVRRDDHRGARLPPRGGEHAGRGPVLRPARPARRRSSPDPTRSWSPAGSW